MLYYVMLCYAMLCYVLFCSVLSCSVLLCTIYCYRSMVKILQVLFTDDSTSVLFQIHQSYFNVPFEQGTCAVTIYNNVP